VRAPKLYALVQNNPFISSNPSLVLREVEAEPLRALLEFLFFGWTGVLESGESFEKQLKLFHLAVLYEVGDLAAEAFLALASGVSVPNWIDLFCLYQIHQTRLGPQSPALNLIRKFFQAYVKNYCQSYFRPFFNSRILIPISDQFRDSRILVPNVFFTNSLGKSMEFSKNVYITYILLR
jgi:hypothetical protein